MEFRLDRPVINTNTPVNYRLLGRGETLEGKKPYWCVVIGAQLLTRSGGCDGLYFPDTQQFYNKDEIARMAERALEARLSGE